MRANVIEKVPELKWKKSSFKIGMACGPSQVEGHVLCNVLGIHKYRTGAYALTILAPGLEHDGFRIVRHGKLGELKAFGLKLLPMIDDDGSFVDGSRQTIFDYVTRFKMSNKPQDIKITKTIEAPKQPSLRLPHLPPNSEKTSPVTLTQLRRYAHACLIPSEGDNVYRIPCGSYSTVVINLDDLFGGRNHYGLVMEALEVIRWAMGMCRTHVNLSEVVEIINAV